MPEARSGRRRGLHLVKRDLAILETLVVRRAETLDWLHRQHFDGLTRKRALNRLGDLVAAGYLHRVTLEVADVIGEPPASQSVYTLGPKARAALELRSLSSEHFRYRRWNPTLRDSSIPHQIVVNRIAELLRADMVPEHLLPATTREQARHKPDAVWERPPHPETKGDVVFLEVDLGHYSRERLVGKYEAFKNHARADVLLIVVPNMTRVVKVAGWLYDAGAPDLKATTGKEIAIWSFDELLGDLQYYADRFGSNPIADFMDPTAYPPKPA